MRGTDSVRVGQTKYLTTFGRPYSSLPSNIGSVWRGGERNLQEQKKEHTCAERAQTQVTSSQRRTTKMSQGWLVLLFSFSFFLYSPAPRDACGPALRGRAIHRVAKYYRNLVVPKIENIAIRAPNGAGFYPSIMYKYTPRRPNPVYDIADSGAPARVQGGVKSRNTESCAHIKFKRNVLLSALTLHALDFLGTSMR